MKGIILAAGKGTRLYPITKPCCKPLLPVYDKPMIYYPLTTLIEAGIRDILVIVPPEGGKPYEDLLGDGSRFGVKISYKEQPVARGIADAFIVGRDFIGKDGVCLVLGDNIFYGRSFGEKLARVAAQKQGATVFGYYVEDPRPFGVVEIGADGKALSIEEKPQNPKSNYIIPGLYFYDNRVVDIAGEIQPSARGELEITSVNNCYLEQNELCVVTLDKDFSWFDTGNAESMFEAASAIRECQRESGMLVGSPEECAFRQEFISKERLADIGNELNMTAYGKALLKTAGEI